MKADDLITKGRFYGRFAKQATEMNWNPMPLKKANTIKDRKAPAINACYRKDYRTWHSRTDLADNGLGIPLGASDRLSIKSCVALLDVDCNSKSILNQYVKWLHRIAKHHDSNLMNEAIVRHSQSGKLGILFRIPWAGMDWSEPLFPEWNYKKKKCQLEVKYNKRHTALYIDDGNGDNYYLYHANGREITNTNKLDLPVVSEAHFNDMCKAFNVICEKMDAVQVSGGDAPLTKSEAPKPHSTGSCVKLHRKVCNGTIKEMSADYLFSRLGTGDRTEAQLRELTIEIPNDQILGPNHGHSEWTIDNMKTFLGNLPIQFWDDRVAWRMITIAIIKQIENDPDQEEIARHFWDKCSMISINYNANGNMRIWRHYLKKRINISMGTICELSKLMGRSGGAMTRSTCYDVSIYDFIIQWTVPDSINTNELKMQYNEYCEKCNIKPVPPKSFLHGIREILKVTPERINGKKMIYHFGKREIAYKGDKI